MTVLRRPRWIVAAGIVVLLLVLFASQAIFASTPDDTAVVAAHARAALNLKDGECMAVGKASYPEIDPEAVDAAGKSLVGPGWVGRVFIGTSDQAAAALGGIIAASGARTAWVYSSDARTATRSLVELTKVDLPSAQTAWATGERIQTGAC